MAAHSEISAGETCISLLCWLGTAENIMRPLPSWLRSLTAGLFIVFLLPHRAAVEPVLIHECVEAYREPDYKITWALSLRDWTADCEQARRPELILTEAKEKFIRSCIEESAPTLQAGLMSSDRIAAYCAQGMPGKTQITKPIKSPAQSSLSNLRTLAEKLGCCNGPAPGPPPADGVPLILAAPPPDPNFDEEFEKQFQIDKDINKKIDHYAQKSPYIQRCLENRFIPDRTMSIVASTTHDLCKKQWHGDHERSRTAHFSLHKSRGRIRLSTSLYFDYKGKQENKDASMAKLEKSKECMGDFFARHGIELDLRLHVNSGIKDWVASDKAINLWDDYPHVNSNSTV